MRTLKIVLGVVVVCFCWAASSFPQTGGEKVKVVRFGKLIDGTGKVLTNAVVVVKGDRIESVGSGGSQIPVNAQVIDMSAYTGMPGIIDVHTHMTYWRDKNSNANPNEEIGKLLPQELVFLAQENARRCIDSGVTTVRDLAARNYSDIAMKKLINRGVMVGPRMFVAGPAMFGGASVPRYGEANPWVIPRQGEASGVAEVMRLVRQEIEAGADVIKMFGGTGGFNDVETYQIFTLEEMQAAVEATHTMGKRIAIHSYGPEGARDAVKAGTDTLEHAINVDDATFAEMVRKKIVYVPTVYHNVWYIENYKEFGWPESDNEKIRGYEHASEETTRRAIKAGVRIAMGSDAVYELFGHNTEELTYLVKSGMTPEQAIAAATVNGAVALGMEKDLGQVTAGHYADIIAMKGDPLTDIGVVVHNVRWVMKGGEVVSDQTNSTTH
jgi:imidazolonepropionase-like amidohydrolase